jgi:hypothetical protein
MAFKSGDEVFHSLKHQFGKITGEKVGYGGISYYVVLLPNEPANFDRRYWASQNIIKVESEQHRLSLLLKYS